MISTESGSHRFSRLEPKNWSLPVKLAAVLAVPIILALALGVLRVAEQIHHATELSGRDRYLSFQERVSALIGALQHERDQSALFVASNRTGDRAALKNIFGTVDGGLTDLNAAIGNPATLTGGSGVIYLQAKNGLSRLASLRDQVTGAGGSSSVIIAQYTGLIEPLLVFESALDRQLDASTLGGLENGLSSLNFAREQISLQHVVIAVVIARDELLPVEADTVRAADARLSTAINQFRGGLDASQRQRFLGWTTISANTQREQIEQTALSRVGIRGQLGISQVDWDTDYQAVLEALRGAETGLRDEIKARSAAAQEVARNASGVDSVVLLLGMLATSAVVYLIGRSLLNPLQVLRRTALDVADRRLPAVVQSMREGKAPDVSVEPVPVTSIEEIGQVARAFDAVHGQAVRLAAEQAILQANVSSMFVNLSRRSQGLVERQLQLIEQLERNEQDAEQLSNLFQLDHLATRMRRNSENLLVLAGSELAKRSSQVVPVVDVLRAAVSEIEQYQRVVVQTPPDVRIIGRAASDLVHLIAELLDNATTFSPPETQVVVSSSQGPDGSVLVEIADQGVGMPGEDLIAANNRLAGPAEVDVSASRRMGLFVVGRLASRHGIGVRLASSDPARGTSSGVTASVNVPNYLVSTALPGGDAPDAPDVGRAMPRPGEQPSGQNRVVETSGTATFSAFTPVNGVAHGPANGSSWSGSAGLSTASVNRRSPGASDGSDLPVRRLGSPAVAAAGGDPAVAAAGGLPRRTAGASLTGRPDPDSVEPDRVEPDRVEPKTVPQDPTLIPATERAVNNSIGTWIPPQTDSRSAEASQRMLDRPSRPEEPRVGERPAEQSLPVERQPAQADRSQPLPGRGEAPETPRSRVPKTIRQVRQTRLSVDGETTGESPIFEEMASAWFRDNWETPSRSQPPSDAAASEARVGLTPGVPPEVPEPHVPPESLLSWGGENQGGDNDADERGDGLDDFGPSWDSGEQLLQPMPETAPSELTSAGLPKRQPRSQLIPSSSSNPEQSASPVSVPSRNAEQVRGRLASYQQGVRQGRQNRLRTDPANAANANTKEEGS
ncbi:MAG: nitrate- and nitrite sensing domain-containing protein [Pseudonocardia sp.]|nr:nitrate- and nitrite sensing domain-containing protein [Pseudonocardia sp.]